MIALVGAPALQADAAVIPEGIYAGERSLGGMEEDDALTAVEEYVTGLAGQQITMDVNGVAAVTTAQELGSGEGRSGRIHLWQCDPSLF